MDYARAVIEAHRGLKLVRPHWHWVYMSLSEKSPDKLALFEEDGRERNLFKPSRSDRKATDWKIGGDIPDAATHGDGRM